MPAKTRPYLFYDVAISICSQCFRKVEGKVYVVKRCPLHGEEKVLMADDVEYYKKCREVFIKPPEMPLAFNTPSALRLSHSAWHRGQPSIAFLKQNNSVRISSFCCVRYSPNIGGLSEDL